MATAVAAPTPPQPLTRRFRGASKIGEYEMICKLGEGTFGEVHKARQIRTGNIVALKKILMHNEKDGFPITALREIKLLKMLCHDNVLKLEEMAVERLKGEGKRRAILYMVTPYMDHDLSGLLDNPDVHFSEPQIKCYMLQLLKGLRYLHDNHILHRDMKAANLLINNRGRLQIADFGLARHYDEPVPQRGKGNGEAQRDYTHLVVTRWYRPPELLLSLRRYTPAIDMWGAGCVFGEMFKRKPILAGTSDLNQAHIIFYLMGTPNDQNMPGWDELPGGLEIVKNFPKQPGNLNQVFRELGPSAISLLSELLKLDWRKRINAIDAIDHPYFKQDPKPMREEDIPHFQESHELDRRNARGNKQALPPAPAGGTVGKGPNGEWTGSGPPPNGTWTNSDRRGWPPQDRGPPGVPPGQGHRGYDRGRPYDHRAPPPPPRQPDWGSGRNHGQPHDGPRQSTLPPPPGEGRHPLPPPPPAPPQYRGPGPERGQDRPSHRDRDRDVYIPNYNAGHQPPMNRHSRDPEDRPRRGSRDSANSQDRYLDDRSERNRGHRDRDGPPRDGRDYGRDRRTRSRSPDRRDRGRDQHNIYRR